MTLQRRFILIAALALGVILITGVAAKPQDTNLPIRLKYASFDPLDGEPAMPSVLRSRDNISPYRLVQFRGPIEPSWREAVEQAGATILDYVPDFAFLVRADEKALEKVAKLPMVRWIGLYQPAYKLSADLQQPEHLSPCDVMVQLFAGEDPEPLVGLLKRQGAKVASVHSNPFAVYIRATVAPSSLVELAHQPAVCWIGRRFEPAEANDLGRSIIKVNEVWTDTGLYGAGQIVAVCDTGLDSGNASTLHWDFRGRLLKGYGLGRPGDWSDLWGHGTHVAGSIVGNGARSGSEPAARRYVNSFAGVAPEAYLVFQSVKAGDKFSAGIPDDLNALFGPPYQDGARVHSNSWGGPSGGDENPYGGYIAEARQVDEFVWSHRDMVILFAAGNAGTDADKDGVVDLDSMQYPGTAKSCITVGATESQRSSGGYERTWGEIWPNDYPERPINNDRVSNDPRGMAAFSSRGPTDDGRIKPDLCAPGTNIVSTRSQQGDSTGWGIYNSHYLYMGGTSMATPLVAGAATLVRERYVRYQGLNPSAALVKATLINGADNIAPGQYPIGPCAEIPPRLPNPVTGWGRVNLQNAIAPRPPRWVNYADHPGVSSGQTVSFNVDLSGVASQSLTAFVPLSPTKGSALQASGSCIEALSDRSFEFRVGWQTYGNVWWSRYAHSGNYSAWLGSLDNAEDWLWQTVQIPWDASRVTLSFWYDAESEESYCGYDYFWVGFYEYGDWDDYLAELLWQDGRAVTSGWTYQEITLREEQLAAIRGRTVNLAFEMRTDRSAPSGVRLDDVSLQVCTGAENAPPAPFRATLVWSDYPGSLAAAKALVNDLDLLVVAPDGTGYLGNGGTQPDRFNPVEDVIIQNPLPGRYRIYVSGYHVPFGPQPFALVVSASGGESPQNRHSTYLPLLMKNRWRRQ